MSLQFLKAGTSDAPVLNAISKHAFENDAEVGAPSAGGPPGYMSLKYHIKMARSGHLFKLTENGLIIGGAILFPDGDTLNIGRIFINPDCHRKGYGIRMMQEIEALFPEIRTYTLDTPAWNNRTNSFYLKLGYTEVKRNNEFVYYSKQRMPERKPMEWACNQASSPKNDQSTRHTLPHGCNLPGCSEQKNKDIR